MKKTQTPATREKISRAMRGKKNAKKYPENMERLTLYLPKDLVDALKIEAENKDVTINLLAAKKLR